MKEQKVDPKKGLILNTCKDCVKISVEQEYSCSNCYRNTECDQDGKSFVQVHKCHVCNAVMERVERLGVKDMSSGEYGWIEWYTCVNTECSLPLGKSRFRRDIK